MAKGQYNQGQLILPLLEAADDAGGRIATGDAYEAIADRLGLDEAARTARRPAGTQSVKSFAYDVRWAQQKARLEGLMRRTTENEWELTGRGAAALRKARPGLVVTIFTTAKGVALWASCADAAALLDEGSVSLVMTSPPYALQRVKAYQQKAAETEFIDWLLREIERWPRVMRPDGSLVLNLGDAFRPGLPHVSTYQERLIVRLEDELGFKLCQRFAWHNPAKMPVPAEWVTIRRVRVKPSVEQIYWLSQSDHPFADNRAVLTDYSTSMRRRLAQGGEKGAQTRPAGYALKDGAFGQDLGGAIPGNLIVAPNTQSRGRYQDGCRADGLPIHPARFPEAVPEFFVKMLTRPDDLVFDPFGGSSTTGAVAERLGRRWITSDQMLDYVQGAQHRFMETRSHI
jgi:DNA modification methylase